MTHVPGEFDQLPPDTDPTMHISEGQWRNFIAEEERKLYCAAAESIHGTSERERPPLVR